MTLRYPHLSSFIIVTVLCLWVGCNSSLSPSQKKLAERSARSTAGRDLSLDDARGGHTLKKHVGRSDQDLRERLQREHKISAASTYTDRHTAEVFVAGCLEDNHVRVQQWLDQERHPNLALDCIGDPAWPLGRTLHRGQSRPEPCSNATLVLKWTPPLDYYVLTSYPDCR